MNLKVEDGTVSAFRTRVLLSFKYERPVVAAVLTALVQIYARRTEAETGMAASVDSH
jgi:hypothetical protein